MVRKSHLLGLFATGLLSANAMAGAGDLLLRVGAHSVNPKSNNHPVVNVDSAASLTLNATYFLTDNLAVDVLGAVPFKHDINLNAGGSKVGSTKHLPPTIGLQYHFLPDAAVFRPYVAAGLNYTFFFSTDTQGALAGKRLDLGSSFGLAGEIGADFIINDAWSINVDARYMKIGTTARLDGASLGKVNIDPYAYGIMISRRFKLK